jgi:DNA-binding HxlR family transcriptional regulator
MEEDGLIERKIFAEIPPRVEYYMSDYGKTLFPVIDMMSEWGLKDMELG